jgi:hypothetical protein
MGKWSKQVSEHRDFNSFPVSVSSVSSVRSETGVNKELSELTELTERRKNKKQRPFKEAAKSLLPTVIANGGKFEPQVYSRLIIEWMNSNTAPTADPHHCARCSLRPLFPLIQRK